jgi:hypothetical protein
MAWCQVSGQNDCNVQGCSSPSAVGARSRSTCRRGCTHGGPVSHQRRGQPAGRRCRRPQRRLCTRSLCGRRWACHLYRRGRYLSLCYDATRLHILYGESLTNEICRVESERLYHPGLLPPGRAGSAVVWASHPRLPCVRRPAAAPACMGWWCCSWLVPTMAVDGRRRGSVDVFSRRRRTNGNNIRAAARQMCAAGCVCAPSLINLTRGG